MRILCSTGAFTRTSDPLSHEAIVRHGPQFDVDGFEVLFYPRWYADQASITRELRASRLAFLAVHVEKSVGEVLGSADQREYERGIDCFERNCDFAQEIGANIVILHLWGLPHSDTYLERNLSLLPRCVDIAERHGLALAVETIPCATADPLTNIKRACDFDARSRVALDTEFLSMHDQLDAIFEAQWLWQSSLVQHVHLKDFDAIAQAGENRRYLHPGDGQIDFRRFLRQLRAKGFDGALSLESRGIDSENHVDVARIQTSLRMIAELAREA